MRKIGLFLVGVIFLFYSLIFISIANSKEITVITEELRCPRLKIVLQHKELAIKLTFSGIPSPITDEKDGSLRCRTTKEVIDMLEIHSPEYYLVEYYEDE